MENNLTYYSMAVISPIVRSRSMNEVNTAKRSDGNTPARAPHHRTTGFLEADGRKSSEMEKATLVFDLHMIFFFSI